MRNIKLAEGLPFDVPAIEDQTDLLPSHPTKMYKMRASDQVQYVVVHHTAHYASIMNHARFHINQRGFPRIGYHILISDGKIIQTNDLNAESFHCSGWNHNSIGISINADLTKRQLTDEERNLLYAAILTVQSLYDIKEVIGHNEASARVGKPGTTCPATSMPAIRADIAALQTKIIEHEETDSSNVVPSNRDKIQKMLNRTAELVGIFNDKSHKYNLEAERKLLAIDEAITEKGFYK